MDKQICKKYAKCFQNNIKSKQLGIKGNVDKTWGHINERINETALKVLGKKYQTVVQ